MSSSVTYTAELDMRRETVLYVSGLLHAERRRLGTRRGRRSLGCFAAAVLVLRWFLDGTRVEQPAADNAVSVKTVYRYLHEGIDLLAAHAPDLQEVLDAARTAGLSHVNLDGVVIATHRVKTPGPNGADLWWSGKHKGEVRVTKAATADLVMGVEGQNYPTEARRPAANVGWLVVPQVTVGRRLGLDWAAAGRGRCPPGHALGENCC